MVRTGWRAADGPDPRLARYARSGGELSLIRVLRDADLARPPAPRLSAGLAGKLEVSDQQDRSRRDAVCPFPGARGGHGPLPALGLAEADISVAATGDPVRPALAGYLLHRRVPGLCRPFHSGGNIVCGRAAFRH